MALSAVHLFIQGPPRTTPPGLTVGSGLTGVSGTRPLASGAQPREDRPRGPVTVTRRGHRATKARAASSTRARRAGQARGNGAETAAKAARSIFVD